jgi:hypothetical protein
MTSTTISDQAKARILEQAIGRLREAAELLNELYDDSRVRYCLAHLEGMGEGWFHFSQEQPDYLIDLLDDVRLEALATPLGDHWRGHPMMVEEAEALL